MTYDPEIEKLLPWYEKGLLDPKDAMQVEAYLEEHPEMRMQLDLIAEEIEAVEQNHAALGAPAPGGLDRLMADIDALEAEQKPVAQKAKDGFLAKLQAFLDNFKSPGMQFAAMAAALVIVAQGVLLGGVFDLGRKAEPTILAEPATRSGRSFTTASGPKQAVEAKQQATVAKLLVAFKAEATMGAVTAFLKEINAKIETGPKAGGFYELHIAEDKLPEGGAAALLARLKERSDLVKFASAVR